MYVKQITYRLVLLQRSRRNSSINSCLSYRIWGQTPWEFRPKKSSLYSRRGVSAVGFPPSEIHLATWQVQYHLNRHGGSMDECASYLRYSDVLRYKVIHLGQLLDNHWPNRKWSWVRVSPGLWLTEVSGYNFDFYIPHLPGKSVDDIISQKNVCQYDSTARTGGMKETFHLWQIDIFISNINNYIYISISLFSMTPIDICNSSGSRCFAYSDDTFKPRNSDRKCRQSPVGRNFWYTRHAAGFTAITWNRASWCRGSRFPKIDALYMVFPVSKETFLGWNIMGFKYKLL